MCKPQTRNLKQRFRAIENTYGVVFSIVSLRNIVYNRIVSIRRKLSSFSSVSIFLFMPLPIDTYTDFSTYFTEKMCYTKRRGIAEERIIKEKKSYRKTHNTKSRNHDKIFLLHAFMHKQVRARVRDSMNMLFLKMVYQYRCHGATVLLFALRCVPCMFSFFLSFLFSTLSLLLTY